MSTTYAMKWTANAIQTVPNLSDLVSSGYPTNGDPSKGIAPTLPGAAWFHWISQTLGCAIQGNGLTIDQTKTDQLLSAMKNLGKMVVPIGTVVFYLGTTIPDGYLLCNGASLSRTEFPELFAVLGTKCGSVDSAHFTLPDTHHRFLEGTTTLSEVGSYIAAGLPNSKGQSSWQLGCGGISESGSVLYYNGALSVEKSGTRQCTPATTMVAPGDITIRLNLSQGNAIYSDAVTTVRPEALRAYSLIRYS